MENVNVNGIEEVTQVVEEVAEKVEKKGLNTKVVGGTLIIGAISSAVIGGLYLLNKKRKLKKAEKDIKESESNTKNETEEKTEE